MNMKKTKYVVPNLEVVEMEFGVLLSTSIDIPVVNPDPEHPGVDDGFTSDTQQKNFKDFNWE